MSNVDPNIKKILLNYMKSLNYAEKIVNKTKKSRSSHSAKQKECIKKYCELDDEAKILICSALRTRLNAYAPYSNFKVGAAFRSDCGKIFTGCNVENVAFTPSCCAERNALGKAVSEGCTKFEAGAVVANNSKGFTTPCGVCRQFMNEFANHDIILYVTTARDGEKRMINDEDDVMVTSIYNLLPHSFSEYK